MSAQRIIARPRRIMLQTLGCPKNTVDSAQFAALLSSAAFEMVTQPSRADVIVVNTCGFLDDAKLEAIEILLDAVRWKQARSGRQVLAMGCLTQRDGAEIEAQIPELDGVFGIGDWTRMLNALRVNPLAAAPAAFDPFSAAAGPGSAYLRIADGCSHACAFCSIPQMRGLYRSEPLDKLCHSAAKLAASGVKELILIGQEISSYGVETDRRRRLVDLCQRLSEIEGVEWIRLLYLHPPSTPPALLEELAAVPKLAPYIDFPIEHASDRMLKRMNRRTTAARMREAIAVFRAALPGACVRTTALVGFPGETDEDFAELYRFLEEVRFERAGVFAYSPQEGTAGAELADPVEEGIALDRLDRLMRLQRGICGAKHRELVGRDIRVLIERCGRGVSWGRSAWDAPEIDGRVRVPAVLQPGEMVTVRVTQSSAYQLEGQPAHAGSREGHKDSCAAFALPVFSR